MMPSHHWHHDDPGTSRRDYTPPRKKLSHSPTHYAYSITDGEGNFRSRERARRRSTSRSARHGDWTLGGLLERHRAKRKTTRWDVGSGDEEHHHSSKSRHRAEKGRERSPHSSRREKDKKNVKGERTESKKRHSTKGSSINALSTFMEPLTAFVDDRPRLAIEMMKSVDEETRNKLLPQLKVLLALSHSENSERIKLAWV